MKRILTAVVGLALLTAACGGDDDSTEAAPTIVIDGETAASGDATERTEDAADTTEAAADTDEPAEAEGADAAGVAAVDATDEEIAIEFAQCMRDNGVPGFEDPVVNADGSIDLAPGGPGAIDAEQDDLEAAFEVCGDLLAGASFLPGADLDQAELEDDLLAMAQCLRDLGNDVDDPDLGGGFGPGQAQSLFGPNFDPTDPANTADIAVCQDEVFGPDGPPGPGQGGN